MRARSWSGLALVALLSATAAAEPKPKPVDIKAFKDKLVVLTDPAGGIYVVLPGKDGRAWYGTGGKSKNLYEQIVVGRFSDGTTGRFDLSIHAPRVPDYQPGSISRKDDGTYARWCGRDDQTQLTELVPDKAKTIIDKWSFMSTAMIRGPYFLARDDAGVYYYVDQIRKEYGGKGYRVFIGKKGAMKQKPLTDIATDTAGDVFATKTGDIRIVRDMDAPKPTVNWVKGEKRTPLSYLEPENNLPLIYKDLGVYSFTGSICENI